MVQEDGRVVKPKHSALILMSKPSLTELGGELGNTGFGVLKLISQTGLQLGRHSQRDDGQEHRRPAKHLD